MTEAASSDSLTTPGERLIPVDVEHFAVRLLVPILTVVAALLTHFVGLQVLGGLVGDAFSPLCILLPLDLVVLLTAGMGIERVLKRLLPSKRSARLNGEEFVLTDAKPNPPDVRKIQWDRGLNISAWHFVVKRRTRVPKGWYCMALYLLQDETEVILYTFMAPKEAEALPVFDQFVRLRPRKETETGSDLRQVATQRRLLKLEDARWNGGAEIASADFQAVLAEVRTHVAAWS